MNTESKVPTASGSPNRPRPSLIASNADARPRSEAGHADSILTSIESDAGITTAPTPSLRRLAPFLALAAIAAAIAYLVISLDDKNAARTAPQAWATSDTHPAATAATGAMVAVSPSTDIVTTQPALVENVATAPIEANDSAAASATPSSSVATSDNRKSNAISSSSKRVHATAVESAKPKMKSKSATAAKVKRGEDSDVDLIAALVAHAEGRQIGGKEKAAAGNSIASPPGGTTGAAATSAQSHSAPAPGTVGGDSNSEQGVVIPEPSVTTAELLQRCRTIGFVEGALCRARICGGLRAKDPACPQRTSGDAPLTGD
jgi:hypothetical protein